MRRARKIVLLMCAALAAALIEGAPARADSPPPAPSQQQVWRDMLKLGQGQLTLPDGATTIVPRSRPQMVEPTDTGYGEYTRASVTADTLGNVYATGTAVGLSRKRVYQLVGVLYLDGIRTDGTGPITIENATSGHLQTISLCVFPGTYVSYNVGLLNSSSTIVLDDATASTLVP